MYSEDAGGQNWNPNHANEDFDVLLFVKKTSCGASQSVSNFKPSVHSWMPRPSGQLIQQQTRGAASMTPPSPDQDQISFHSEQLTLGCTGSDSGRREHPGK